MIKAKFPLSQRTQERLIVAVEFALDEIQSDPDVRHYCGIGTEMFAHLCLAEAAVTGENLETIHKRRRESTTPKFRRQVAEIEILRTERKIVTGNS